MEGRQRPRRGGGGPSGSTLTNLDALLQKFTWKSASNKGQQQVFLVASGAYAPIHNMHLHMMEVAKTWLEVHKGWHVCGGLICPAGDGYVAKKLKGEHIPEQERLQVCRLAVQNSDWLTTGRVAKGVWVCGADHALRRNLFLSQRQTFFIVIIGREDGSSTANLKKAMLHHQHQHKTLPTNLFLVESLSQGGEEGAKEEERAKRVWQDFQEYSYLSSTLVRQFMRQEASLRGLVPDVVAEYLEQRQQHH
ncbi:Nicotinamide/nicotinic acid mononucleotide adenylyltransferase 1 [Balamuthia mandrillaris]